MDILMKRGPRVPQCLFDAFMETHNEECAKKLAPYLLAQEQHALKKTTSGKGLRQTFLRIPVSLDINRTN